MYDNEKYLAYTMKCIRKDYHNIIRSLNEKFNNTDRLERILELYNYICDNPRNSDSEKNEIIEEYWRMKAGS